MAEFVIYQYHKKHSTRGFISSDIRNTQDKEIINIVLANIISIIKFP